MDSRDPFRGSSVFEVWLQELVAPDRSVAVENDSGFVVEVDVPGLRREDLEVTVDRRLLTVRGVRAKRQIHRQWRLPAGVDADSIEAKLADGVLSLTIPKVEARSQARTIAIT